jgi:Icc-related predicted phosphoesterase
MRIAAVGDLHVGPDSRGRVRGGFADLRDHADLILLAGDLTQHGDAEEARVLAEELAELSVPAFAVLGNHDYHRGQEDVIRRELEAVGIRVLECETASLEIAGTRVGIAGAKGFGGGFAGACCSDFGEPEMKAFVRTTKEIGERLEHLLVALDADVRIALTHYAPIDGTLMGERLEIFPFLGSYLLGEAIDRGGCRLALHGHAHRGRERGVTPGGVPVRNVARPVIQHAYRVYTMDGNEHAAVARVADPAVAAAVGQGR